MARKKRVAQKAQRRRMSKSKSNGVKAAKSEKTVLNKVKDAAVTKPAQANKSKTKEIAKAVVAKEDKKSKKQKKVKEPTPEPESESEESASSESSEDESEAETKPATNGKAITNGAAKAPADSDDDDSEESDDEVPATNGKAAAVESSEEEEDSDEDDESEDEKPAKVTPASKAVDEIEEDSDDSDDDDEEEVPTKVKAAAVSDESDEDSDESDESSEEEEEEAAPVSKKRKAEEESPFAAKKNKAEAATASPSNGTNLFIGNLSWNVDEDWLSQEFGEFGELAGVRVISDRDTGRSKGFGYIEYVNAADAAKAFDGKKGATIDNRAINLDWASGRKTDGNAPDRANARAKTFGDKTSPASDTLFVGNLSFECDQDTVSEAFAEYGTITGVRLPTDRETGAPKGFGYVTFASIDEAKGAFEGMQGYELAGRSVRLDYSQPRPANGDSPMRGGRGGGRGFGGGRGGGRGGFGDRGGRGGGFRGGRGGDRGGRGGRGASTNRGGFGDFSGKKIAFD